MEFHELNKGNVRVYYITEELSANFLFVIITCIIVDVKVIFRFRKVSEYNQLFLKMAAFASHIKRKNFVIPNYIK